MKYPLLLAELLKYTPEGHADREPLERAHRLAKSLAHLVNTRKRNDEGRRRWAVVGPTIEATGGFDVQGNNRTLLLEADLTCGELDSAGKVHNVNTRRFWLCSDVLLCGKAKLSGKYKYRMDAVFRLSADASAVADHKASVSDKEFTHWYVIL